MTRDVPPEEVWRAKMEAFGLVLSDVRWWWHKRTLPDERVLYLLPLLTGNQLGVSSRPDSGCFDDVWHYPHRVEEHSFLNAGWRAVLGWDGEGEPEGWYRHPRSGRRRPDGTPASEFVRD